MSRTHPTRAPRGPRIRRGFTLLETAMTLVIIAVGVLAIIESQQYFFQANTWSSHAATATFLANEVREMTRRYPKHDPVTGLSMVDDGGGGQVLSGWGFENGEITVADFDDIDDFDDMSFRFDGTAASQNEDGVFIIDDNDLPGPIDAFGEVIADLVGGEEGQGAWGWAQTVTVDKVDPFDYTVVYEPDFSIPPAGTFPGLDVHQFPLRVTVTVEYQGPLDASPAEVASVSWIVP